MFKYSIEQLRKERIQNVGEFLIARKLDRKILEYNFRHQTEALVWLLLTSSPVHGFANIYSDLDFICITTQTYREHMSVQYFIENNHIELIGFSQTELSESLYFLEKLLHMSFEESIHEMCRWKQNSVLSKKYIERIVNGVNMDFDCPYIDHVIALSSAWFRQSYFIFRKCLICLNLAEKAGESRAKIAYGINGLLYLMDAVVSSSNSVFNNKKRYLQRYVDFCNNTRLDSSAQAMVDNINSLYNKLICFQPNEAFKDRFNNLYMQTKDEFQLSYGESYLFQDKLEKNIIHTGALLFSNETQAFPVQDIMPGIRELSLSTLDLLKPKEAAYILAGLRSGVFTFNTFR